MPDRTPEHILTLYNPWWHSPLGQWRRDLSDYRRPIVKEILSDLADLPQMISVTGPRRVGKTTALKQVICTLLDDQGVDPRRIFYFSFDDPEVGNYGSYLYKQ